VNLAFFYIDSSSERSKWVRFGSSSYFWLNMSTISFDMSKLSWKFTKWNKNLLRVLNIIFYATDF